VPVRIVIWVVVVVLAVLALLSLAPELPGAIIPPLDGLSGRFPFAQVLALRGWLVLSFAVIGLMFVILGLVRRQLIGSGAGTAILTLGGVFIIVAVAHLVIVFERGTSAATAISRTDDTQAAPDAALTILTLNMEDGGVTGSELVEPIVDQGVDVVVLPEMVEEDAAALAAELTEAGHPRSSRSGRSRAWDR
jgi:hypothetical protein